MNALVVYESRYGNTAEVARAIAAALEAHGSARLVEAADPTAFDVGGVDLLVVGGPTEGHGVSKTLRARLAGLPPDALVGVVAAAFDTRLTWPAFLAGSAAKGVAKMLRRLGAQVVVPPQSFLVTGAEPHGVAGGEIERARAWAGHLTGVTGLAAPLGG